MRAYIRTYEPTSAYAKSKQPLRSRHTDVKRIYAYFVEYGSMDFGPFFSEKSADNFLVNQGFKIHVDDTGIYYQSEYKGKIQMDKDSHYKKV